MHGIATRLYKAQEFGISLSTEMTHSRPNLLIILRSLSLMKVSWLEPSLLRFDRRVVMVLTTESAC